MGIYNVGLNALIAKIQKKHISKKKSKTDIINFEIFIR